MGVRLLIQEKGDPISLLLPPKCRLTFELATTNATTWQPISGRLLPLANICSKHTHIHCCCCTVRDAMAPRFQSIHMMML